MKHSLTFCDIYQISDDIFEVIDNEGVTIDQNCVQESWQFWDTLRKKPFGVLINCQNSFSLSFEGAREIGSHPLQQKTAILIRNSTQREAIRTAIEVKRTIGEDTSLPKVFRDRDKAIGWLENLA